MARPTASTERTKVLSVRLTADEFEALCARATEVGVGPSTLARTLVRSGLAAATPVPASPNREPSFSPLEAGLVAGLAARVEALERWVAEQ